MEVFLSDLNDLLQAGIDVDAALSALSMHTVKHKRYALSLQKSVRQGVPLSYALSEVGFSDIIVHFLKTGEWTGELPAALGKAVDFLRTRRLRRERFERMLAYPAMLTVLSLVVTQLLVSVVLPEFYHLYLSLGIALEDSTRLLFTLGAVVAWVLPLVLLLLVCTAGLSLVIYRRMGLRGFSYLAAYGPWSRLVILMQVKQSMEVLSFLLQGGLDLLTSLKYMAQMNSAGLEREWEQAAHDIALGISFSEVLRLHTRMPQLVIETIALSERTGDVPGSTCRLSGYYTRKMDQAIERFFRYVEPVTTVILGLVVGGATLLFMLPMMSLIRQLS